MVHLFNVEILKLVWPSAVIKSAFGLVLLTIVCVSCKNEAKNADLNAHRGYTSQERSAYWKSRGYDFAPNGPLTPEQMDLVTRWYTPQAWAKIKSADSEYARTNRKTSQPLPMYEPSAPQIPNSVEAPILPMYEPSAPQIPNFWKPPILPMYEPSAPQIPNSVEAPIRPIPKPLPEISP
jgi:hypothetical protein